MSGRYSTYRESGVDWLGPIPSHWGLAALKRGYSVVLGKMLQPEARDETDVLKPYLRAANIKWEGVEETDIKEMWFSKDELSGLRLVQGDLLISEGGDVGRSAIWNNIIGECYFQNSVNRVRPNEGNSSRYLYYWMSVIKDKGYVDVMCNKSTIAHFTAEKVAAVPVPFPPSREQESIASFLDRETAKIDGLIADQQRLIKLLAEKRQAVISQAVTKGLDPKATIKDSGIEWLGDMPSHWEIKRLKYLGAAITGLTYSPDDIVEAGGTLVLRSSNVQGGKIVMNDNVYVSTPITEELVTRMGDILICSRNGSRALIGKNAVIDAEAAGLTWGAFMTMFRSQFSSYIAEVLNSPLFDYQSGAFLTSTINQLTIGVLNNFEIPFPPENERAQIVAWLASEKAKIDAVLDTARTSIALLQERRSALISAAVTGQIDVRDVA